MKKTLLLSYIALFLSVIIAVTFFWQPAIVDAAKSSVYKVTNGQLYKNNKLFSGNYKGYLYTTGLKAQGSFPALKSNGSALTKGLSKEDQANAIFSMAFRYYKNGKVAKADQWLQLSLKQRIGNSPLAKKYYENKVNKAYLDAYYGDSSNKAYYYIATDSNVWGLTNLLYKTTGKKYNAAKAPDAMTYDIYGVKARGSFKMPSLVKSTATSNLLPQDNDLRLYNEGKLVKSGWLTVVDQQNNYHFYADKNGRVIAKKYTDGKIYFDGVLADGRVNNRVIYKKGQLVKKAWYKKGSQLWYANAAGQDTLKTDIKGVLWINGKKAHGVFNGKAYYYGKLLKNASSAVYDFDQYGDSVVILNYMGDKNGRGKILK
ncbi:hypothetical protein [Kurthia sibirica]|uniref:Uncharacterized protein n=1 Tax=Kurthia sibirica TaxID=202750 RepID=A0A2U3AKM3_9BACL|nr:hypothetical protein [Kurthia sibirica]PWI25086.1 hypothetical protein DEX24_10100 [Kurthia sibirica]GEK34005.1 hypothetical protein KSI01_15380 [Kurthia sibirica]